jgi:hypothetical protein
LPIFVDKQTNDGSVLHLVPPLLPWDAPHYTLLIALLMHYMPSQLTNLVKGDLHPASAEHSDGSLIDLTVGSMFVKVVEIYHTQINVWR